MWWMLCITHKQNPLAQTYWKVSQCWAIIRFSIAISITYLNKAACCPHAWTHIEGSLKLITIITSRRMEVGSSGSWPNSKKYSEKDVNETCQLNPYPMANQVTVSPNLERNLSEGHTSTNLVSSSAPFVRPTYPTLRWSHDVIY